MRYHADMHYLYTGLQKKFCPKHNYDRKVKLSHLKGLVFVKEVAPNISLYTAVVNHVTLKQNIRIAYLVDRREPPR